MPEIPAPWSARHAAATALATAAARYPDLPPARLNTAGLSPADVRLALAIHRTSLQRWMTLEHLLNRALRQKMEKLEPPLRAILLSAAAQLLFMPGLPDYAVVDESVRLAKKMVRPGAGGLVNAVLRKLTKFPAYVDDTAAWAPAEDRLPCGPGSLVLSEPLLPPIAPLDEHLAAATSHPAHLVRRWMQEHSPGVATFLAHHGTLTPPTLVSVEDGFDREADDPRWLSHEQPGYIAWQGTHEELVAFLAERPERRVQDPSAAQPVASLRELGFSAALDYCAGMGTKTSQLALEHPGATIYASDPMPARQEALEQLGEEVEAVRAVDPETARQQRVELLLLDVPCSNTGVLARRPEAKYRFTRQSLRSVCNLQRQVIRESLPTLAPGGHLLYSTCSIERAENQEQVAWLLDETGGELVRERLLLPAGLGDRDYRDGGYHALVRVP
ncbi:MAG: transcription antitermination factor NusB [Phycisphaeraceae bacterium]